MHFFQSSTVDFFYLEPARDPKHLFEIVISLRYRKLIELYKLSKRTEIFVRDGEKFEIEDGSRNKERPL